MEQRRKLAILVGGGPAPGINAVIAAATIRARLDGVEVLGVRDGFTDLMHGRVERVRELTIDDVSQIHFRGGSALGIARSSMPAPRWLCATASGTALERPPAPTS